MEISEVKNQRVLFVDYIRCMGIILMIMGHVGFGSTFDKWIHLFHMPIWFFISGYFINTERTFWDTAKKKFKSMIVPFISFSVIFFIINGMLTHKWEFYRFLWPNYYPIPLNGALWFLPALFFSDLISFIFIKYFKQYSIVLLFFIAAIESCVSIKLPFSIDSAIIGCGFVAIGHFFKIKQVKCSLVFSPILFVLACIIGFFNDTVNLRSNSFGCPVIFWVSSIGSVVSLWCFFQKFEKRIMIPIICEIGSESLIYVCLNQAVLAILRYIWDPNNIYIRFVYHLTQVIIIVAVCFCLNRLIKKSRFRFILGR